MSDNKLFGMNIEVRDFVPENEALLIVNGVDNIVKLDGTDKEAKVTIKEPKFVRIVNIEENV